MNNKLLTAQQVIDLIAHNADIILPLTNGEPHKLLDILEDQCTSLTNVKIHQLLALNLENIWNGAFPGQATPYLLLFKWGNEKTVLPRFG